jgi:4-aminobutyrate aminotransferase
MARSHPIVHEVRGLGLMIGVELRDHGEPAPLLRDRVVELAFRRGLLLLPCGLSTVRISPPLCLTGRQVQIGLALFEASLAAAEAERLETTGARG